MQQVAAYVAVAPDTPPDLAVHPVFIALRVGFLFLAGVMGATVAVTLRRLVEDAARAARERESVQGALGAYVDDRIVERVLAGDLTLRPERRTVTVLFLDIRDYTRFAEGRDPGAVLQTLSGALDAFTSDVRREGGYVKFLGDGLMAIFGAPEPQPDHAARAVRAALAMVESTRRLRADGAFPELAIRIGIHSGEVVAGDLGGLGRREYTAIGDVVNVAARLEAANKEFGTTSLVTEDRRLLAADVLCVARPPPSLRGRSVPVAVYEIRTAAAPERAAPERAAPV